MKRAVLADLGCESETLFDSCTVDLSDCLTGDNFEAVADADMINFRPFVYGEKRVELSPIALVRLPPGTRLCGGRHFLLQCPDGSFVAEQIPTPDVASEQALLNSASIPAPLKVVEGACLLVSRFGVMTWGHWLGEILGRIIFAETAFPGRFTYVLPQDIFNDYAPRNPWNSILESIRALGITRNRIMMGFYHEVYQFSDLWSVTPHYENDAFHPDFLRLANLRYGKFTLPPESSGRRVAILRTESKSRNIDNIAEIVDVLRKFEFEFVEIGRLPFAEQVSLFSSSSLIVGVLASGLSGLMFSPPGCRVLTLGPKGYPNTFFIPMIQQRGGRCYDVRGELTRIDESSFIFSDFAPDPAHVVMGIETLLSDKRA